MSGSGSLGAILLTIFKHHKKQFYTVPIGLIIETSLLAALFPGKQSCSFYGLNNPGPFTGKKQHVQRKTYVVDSVHRTGTLE